MSSPKHFIIATAGHVDHGKSTLVKALTGTDPDRLPEEKSRGITIDLGFAELNLSGPDGEMFHAGIVDVPGHEDFVRNMIAGVGSIDLALLVVAIAVLARSFDEQDARLFAQGNHVRRGAVVLRAVACHALARWLMRFFTSSPSSAKERS